MHGFSYGADVSVSDTNPTPTLDGYFKQAYRWRVFLRCRILVKKRDTSMWDVRVDDNSPDLSEVSYLSLDEPNIEAVVFADDGLGGEEIDTFSVSEMTRVD
ncbi:uncharacterized protein DS421_20g693830 [Arachis hypogaea]|nr:uncharacterized protein DS421_20g693830 [Arachis hypogaea]